MRSPANASASARARARRRRARWRGRRRARSRTPSSAATCVAGAAVGRGAARRRRSAGRSSGSRDRPRSGRRPRSSRAAQRSTATPRPCSATIAPGGTGGALRTARPPRASRPPPPIGEEAAPRLAPEQAAVDHLALHQRRHVALVAEVGVEHRLRDREVGVVADQVHQLARPHAKAGAAQARVDRRRLGGALVQQRQRLGVVRAGDAVDDEARRRARVHRRLAPALAELEDRRGDRRRRSAGPRPPRPASSAAPG